MRKSIYLLVLLALSVCGKKEETPAPKAAMRVSFVEPANGATVSSPVKVKMSVEGMTVEPAGKIVPGTGHFHVIIDKPPVAEGTLVPADDAHKHYGKGQTEAELVLKPGKHKLVLQFADGEHKSYGDAMAETIEITVK